MSERNFAAGETRIRSGLIWLPSLDEFRNFFLGNDISNIMQEYSSIVV